MARKIAGPVKDARKKAFAFFDQGKMPADPEVKALGLTHPTRWSYFSDWQKESQKPGYSAEKIDEIVETTSPPVIDEVSTRKGKKPALLIDETKRGVHSVEEAETEETEIHSVQPETERKTDLVDGKGTPIPMLPDFIAGQGISIRVEISAKSLHYYEIAATTATVAGDGNLSIGDFIDDCIEDFFRGRGQSLGLIKLSKEE